MSATALAALFSGWTQTDRLMRVHTVLDADYGADILMVESLQAVEGVSPVDESAIDAEHAICGYKLDITCLSLDAHLDLKKLIGQPILLELQTDASRTELRPFHGHITHCKIIGANAGLARYQLTVEPWLAFLRYRRDSTVYQDMTVLDIAESIFQDYQGEGKLLPKWRLDILDSSIYTKRSYTTQYQETDLHFVMRLLAEEGIFVYVQHEGDADSPSFGSHTLVIADHNGSFTDNPQSPIEFTQPGAVMERDSIDRWRSVRRWQTNAVEVASWDYRSVGTRAVSATSAADNSSDATPLISRDVPGAYAYENSVQGERLANNQMQAIEARNKTFTGAGTVRSFAPGTTFTLAGHANHSDSDSGTDSEDDSNFVILRVVHQARNNLDAALKGQVDQRLGAIDLSVGNVKQTLNRALDQALQPATDTTRPLYRNRIDAIRSKIPYRPASVDAHGTVIHPKPTVTGQHTAIVVGPAGHVIHTDRDHRIKVQFHWQRGANSHSRLSHPNEDGHTGAPANDQSGTWVRVMSGVAPVAGANWGGQAVPRIGQEVLIDFLEGDIDRPVVIGTLYNGKGQPDAQHNQVGQGTGAATGNAPAWFPGEQDGHAHPAALSGIKTQAMSNSQSGNGAYNQLVFDDSPGQSRAALQQHAGAHHGTSELNLGHLRHQTDNQRLMKTGYGFELKTQHSAAIRAGQGLLISTDARLNANGSQLDSREAQTQIEASRAQQLSLATTAQKHNAKLPDETDPDKIAAIAQMQHSVEVVKATASGNGAGDVGDRGGEGQVTAYSEPQLQLSSPVGIVATTPADAILSAGNTSSITAQDINLAAQRGSFTLVKAGISLFTYGKAANAKKPNQETGIKLHAASGKVSMQSQSDETKITADKLITVASITKDVTIAAKDHVLLTAMGSFLKLEGGDITLSGTGEVAFKASLVEFAGPAKYTRPLPLFPEAQNLSDREEKFSNRIDLSALFSKSELSSGMPYKIMREDGSVFEGQLDANGRTHRFFGAASEKLAVLAGDGDWTVDIAALEDKGNCDCKHQHEGIEHDQN